MKIRFSNFPDVFNGIKLPELGTAIRMILRDIELAFAKIKLNDWIIIGGGPPILKHLSATATLNFAAPGAVPGISTATIAVTEAVLGDTVDVSTGIATPANFLPPFGYVSAANTVTIVWFQYAGAPADPDGAGATYRASVWQH